MSSTPNLDRVRKSEKAVRIERFDEVDAADFEAERGLEHQRFGRRR